MLFCLGLSGCGPALPKLAEIDFPRFRPEVRAAVEKALSGAEFAPQDAQSVAELAQVLHAHSLWDAALPYYRHVRQLDPQNATYAHLLGVALYERGQYAEALAELDKALALRPGNHATQYWMAEALLASGGQVRAAEIYRGLRDRAGDTAVVHYGLARTMKSSEALAEFQHAVDREPRFGAAWAGVARYAREAGDTPRAEAAERAAELCRHEAPAFDDPEVQALRDRTVSLEGIRQRAYRAEAKNQLLEASKLYEQVLAAQPEEIPVWARLIGIHLRLKDYAAAEKVCDTVRTSLGHKHAALEAAYGRLLLATRRPGQPYLEAAIAVDPHQAEALLDLARLQTGEAALRLFAQAVAANAASREARAHYARALAQAGKKAEASGQAAIVARGGEDEWTLLARDAR